MDLEREMSTPPRLLCYAAHFTTFMQSMMILLVKNKSNYLSGLNNYRAVEISSAASKLFMGIFLK